MKNVSGEEALMSAHNPWPIYDVENNEELA